MVLERNWVPMKWPCGPLEIARRSKPSSQDAEVKETLAAWALPGSLELLKGTPFNCLIVEWAEGGPQDSAQQQALRLLLEAGRQLGISFVAKISAKENLGTLVETARAAGASAVMLSNPPAESVALPAILQFSREKVAWSAASPIFSSTDNIWPGLGLDTMKGDSAIAGPTGVPWVNSNAWFSLLAEELARGKEVWLDFDPPESSTLRHPADYPLAIADSRAYGSRWMVSLDEKLRAALLRRDAQALAIWGKLCATIAFFERHKNWETFDPQGILAVVSDFLEDNAFLGNEVLNLLNRQGVQFKIVLKSRFDTASTNGLRAILWLDKQAPTGKQQSKLLAFAERGGLVIAQAYWGPTGPKPFKKDASLLYKMYNIRQGQIAVPEEAFADPYQVAVDTHLLVSRRNDLVRLYNPAETNCHSSIGPDGRKRLVQVLNYSNQPAEYVTLWTNGEYSSAQLFMPDAPDPVALKGVASNPGTEFHLPAMSVFSALELEGKNP